MFWKAFLDLRTWSQTSKGDWSRNLKGENFADVVHNADTLPRDRQICFFWKQNTVLTLCLNGNFETPEVKVKKKADDYCACLAVFYGRFLCRLFTTLLKEPTGPTRTAVVLLL